MLDRLACLGFLVVPLFGQVDAAAPDPVASWVADLGKDDEGVRHRGEVALRRAGAKAIPQLVLVLKQSSSEDQRRRILKLIGSLGQDAIAAVPALVDMLEAADRPKLKIAEAINRKNRALTFYAAVALGELVPYSTGDARDRARKCLEVELRDNFGFHITELRRAYFRGDADAAATVKDLIGVLKGDNSYLREAAAEILGERGRDAAAALPVLTEYLEGASHPRQIKVDFGNWSGSSSVSHDEAVRLAAARAIVKIQPAGKLAAKASLYLVRKETDPALLLPAVRSVGMLGGDGVDGLARLLSLVGGEDVAVAAEAATAIGMIGVWDDDVAKALSAAAKRPERNVAVRAAATLKMLQREK